MTVNYVTANPATGETEREFPTMTDEQVADVLARTAAAFEDWRSTPVDERCAVLARLSQAYFDRTDELAAVISREMGKPTKQAAGELALTAMIYKYYAENGPQLLQTETLDPQGAAETVVQRLPVGPLLGIMPWNFPYYQVARFAAPNLLLGNTIVLKHAPICAASSALMAELAHEAGVPADAYINVYASNEQAADMIADPRIQGVSLTGSERAGAAVAEVAARNLKKSVLELGGSDAFILLDTEDVAKSVAVATGARLMNCGQACNSPKRFIVMDRHYDEFVDGLTQAFAATVVGAPDDESAQIGPLSSIAARDGVVEQVATAVEQGATLHTGGEALDRAGAYMAPTVLTGITADMNAYREEIFGPVAMVYKVSSADEAVALANDIDFGLSGSVWSSDTGVAAAVADRLDVGMAMVNEHGTSLPGLPFGGVKRSGYGRELGKWGVGEFVNEKLRRVSPAK